MSLIKPTRKTPYHIDFDWWKQNENDWHVHLRGLLCPQHKTYFEENPDQTTIDFVDPETGEVIEMDALQQLMLSHCSQVEGFISSETQMVESIFRVFLQNGNQPLSSDELAEKINRPANTILITISGVRVYKGIRPAL
jgi:hypothetical protein